MRHHKNTLVESPIETAVPLTADESAAQMVGAERAAIINELKSIFPKFMGDVAMKREKTMDAIHKAQKMGSHIQLYFDCGRVLDSHEDALVLALRDEDSHTNAPPSFAKKLLSLHQRHPDPITNPAIATAELERLEEQLKLIDAGTRQPIEDEPPNAAQLRERKINEAFDFWIRTSQGLEKVEQEYPFTDWRTNELQTLVFQGRKGFESYQRAAAEFEKREK